MRRSMPSGGACSKPDAPDMCDASPEGIAAAKAVCNGCPIVDACAAWLRTLDDPPMGVVAGICFNSRGAVRRARITRPKPPKSMPEDKRWVVSRFGIYEHNDLITAYATRYRVSLERAAQAVGLAAKDHHPTPERTSA